MGGGSERLLRDETACAALVEEVIDYETNDASVEANTDGKKEEPDALTYMYAHRYAVQEAKQASLEKPVKQISSAPADH